MDGLLRGMSCWNIWGAEEAPPIFFDNISFLGLTRYNLHDTYIHKMSTERDNKLNNSTERFSKKTSFFWPGATTPSAGYFFAQNPKRKGI